MQSETRAPRHPLSMSEDRVGAQRSGMGSAIILLIAGFLWLASAGAAVGQEAQNDPAEWTRQAEEAAGELPYAEETQRAMRRIVRGQTAARDLDAAHSTVDRALALAAEMPEDNRFLVLRDMAEAQAEAGDIAGGKKTAESIQDASARAWALARVALIESAVDRDGSISTFESARTAALNVREPLERDGWLSQIVAVQVKAGDIDGAIHTANEMRHRRGKSATLVEVVLAQAQAGEYETARKTAQGIPQQDERALAMCNVAVVQARQGDIDGARSAMDGVRDRSYKESIKRSIAGALARRGDVEEATELAASISDAQQQSRAQSEIASAAAAQGEFGNALSIASEIEDAYYRVHAQMEIATAQADVGNLEDARASFALAAESAVSKEQTRNAIVAQIRAGDLEGARSTIAQRRAILESGYGILHDIAIAQADAGDREGSLESAGSLQEDHRRNAMIRIGAASAREGDLDRARQIADSMDRPFARSAVMRATVSALVDRGELPRAREIAQQWLEMMQQEPMERSHACAVLAFLSYPDERVIAGAAWLAAPD